MNDIMSYRTMASLCRQRAVFDPANKWRYLAQAERWDYLAIIEPSPDTCASKRSAQAVRPSSDSEPAATRPAA